MLSSLLMDGHQAGGYLVQVHPLCKLLLSLLIFVYALAVNSFFALVVLFLAVLTVLITAGLARGVLKILPPCLLLGSVMFLLSYYLGSELENAAIFAIRIFILFHVFIMFGATTSTSAFLRSLHSLKLPPQLSMGLLIVFRFVPVLVSEMKTIALSFSLRKRGLRPTPGLVYRGIMVPFIYRLFTLADELTLALHVRGFGCAPRPTSYKPLVAGKKDLLFMTGGFFILGALHLVALML